MEGENLYEYDAGSGDYNSPYRFNAKELDPETGNYYYGARYYDPKISVWLSVDPLAHKYPSLSPYVFTANNPIMLFDPDGRWIPELDEEGNTTYIAEKGDNFSTFRTQYGLSKSEATEIFINNGLDAFLPQEMSDGNFLLPSMDKMDFMGIKRDAQVITTIEPLRLDYSVATDKQKVEQTLFALNAHQGKDGFLVSDYFQNIPSVTTYGLGNGDYFESYSSYSGEYRKIGIWLNPKAKHPIGSHSSDNFFQPHHPGGPNFIFNYNFEPSKKLANGMGLPGMRIHLFGESFPGGFVDRFNGGFFTGESKPK